LLIVFNWVAFVSLLLLKQYWHIYQFKAGLKASIDSTNCLQQTWQLMVQYQANYKQIKPLKRSKDALKSFKFNEMLPKESNQLDFQSLMRFKNWYESNHKNHEALAEVIELMNQLAYGREPSEDVRARCKQALIKWTKTI
jgi:hypothetical protein